jgi:hypothetical protein
LEQRAYSLDQTGDHYNFGQSRERRSNTWDAFCSDPVVKGRILSIKYSVSSYGAGAAHPNFGYITFNFFLDPFCKVGSLREVFDGSEEALRIIQSELMAELLKSRWDEDKEGSALSEDDIRDGTQDWDSISNFIFGELGIEFVFGPYHVGPYAAGAHSAIVPYGKISRFMTNIFQSALDEYHYDGPQPPWIENENWSLDSSRPADSGDHLSDG